MSVYVTGYFKGHSAGTLGKPLKEAHEIYEEYLRELYTLLGLDITVQSRERSAT